jgi:hypothetical protein
MFRASATALATGAILSGCVAPARWYSAYEGKAETTADHMVSAVETARLSARVAVTHHGFAPYLSVTIAEAEQDADSIQGAFDSIQPPDHRSDLLRDQLDQLLSKATDIISKMRIAARRSDFGEVERLANTLADVSERLDAFAQAHA